MGDAVRALAASLNELGQMCVFEHLLDGVWHHFDVVIEQPDPVVALLMGKFEAFAETASAAAVMALGVEADFGKMLPQVLDGAVAGVIVDNEDMIHGAGLALHCL